MSIAAGAVGQASPIEAVNWFVGRGEEPGSPSSGWQTAGQDELGVNVASGGATLHVVHLPNGTWMVDEGRRC